MPLNCINLRMSSLDEDLCIRSSLDEDLCIRSSLDEDLSISVVTPLKPGDAAERRPPRLDQTQPAIAPRSMNRP